MSSPIDFGIRTQVPPGMFVFEGPEKRLEVWFKRNCNQPMGMRLLSRDEWQVMLDDVKCTILSQMSNEHMDSYVLSESSLFVYRFKIMLKTCGTTTLLNCLEKLKLLANKCSTEIESVLFSRKNYNFPDRQIHPHRSFHSEATLLEKFMPGAGHVLGPVLSGDHHYVYYSGKVPVIEPEFKNQTYLTRHSVELLMSDLDPEAMKLYFKKDDSPIAKDITISTGQSSLFKQMSTDEYLFDPCGFSVNGISDIEDAYFTVHITPERAFSFTSFETNVDDASNPILLNKVVQIFKPSRFSMVLTSPYRDPQEHDRFGPEIEGFLRKYRAHYELEGGLSVTCCNYIRDNSSNVSSLAA
eukprot:TRINITY_DN79_c3_g6_i1.p1 TRINITY_DN79_c3_g6~~TRINITY_DN79_c3_g6_i1.p1  ORF type:complete len:354 (-),score=148.17 TRINITY_DN79_c3_g6_i1:68-1129(-)